MEERLKVKSIIEIVGTPKEHVEKAINFVIEKLSNRQDAKIIDKEVFPAEKVKDMDPFWSCFCDVELDVANVEALLTYCFDFMPSSVEIIEPATFTMQNFKLKDVFNDILARLHQYDMLAKNEHARVILLQRELEKIKGGKPEEKKQEKEKKEGKKKKS